MIGTPKPTCRHPLENTVTVTLRAVLEDISVILGAILDDFSVLGAILENISVKGTVLDDVSIV